MKEEIAVALLKVAAEISNAALAKSIPPVAGAIKNTPVENFHACLSEVHKAYLDLTGKDGA